MYYKSIIIASPPRTGSVWTLNILREIFIKQKISVIPQKIPRETKNALKYHFKNISEDKKNLISIIKVEDIFKKEVFKNTKIIINFRDPRDAVMSYKRFMKHKKFKFEDILELIRKFTNWIDYYRKNFSNEQLLEINYKDINAQPFKIFNQLESFLDLKVGEKQTSEIVNKFSKKKVLNIIKKKDDYVRDAFNNKKHINSEDMIIEDKKIIAAFDVSTGFQTGHISNFNDGDWSKGLSESEINIINTTFGEWFKKNDLSK